MTHPAMNKDKTKPPKTPTVLKKLNAENLLLIERGLLGDIPEKLRPPFVPVRGNANDLRVAKPSGLLSACLPIVPESPSSDKVVSNPWGDESISPIKKSYSFRDKISRLNLFHKEKSEKPKYKTIHEDEKHWDTKKRYPKDVLASPKLDRRSAKAEHDYKSNKRFWFFRNRDLVKTRNTKTPIYLRSKSFEFLPKAATENNEDDFNKPLVKQYSFAFGSSDTIGESSTSNESIEYASNNDHGIQLKSFKNINISRNNSLSDVNSDSSGVQPSIFKSESVQILLNEFDKAVHMFSENYVSDSEVYIKTKEITVKEKRKSASFSTFPNEKVILVPKNHELKNEFSVYERAPPPSPRRGSCTDWFILEDQSGDKFHVSHADNKYKRAQKNPNNRVRRISSTKYWITPEECAVYSREQRPPLIIPRITQYRPPTNRLNNNVYFDSEPSRDGRGRQYERLQDSPKLSRSYSKADSDSPLLGSFNKRLGVSTELLNQIGEHHRRQNHLNIPASSSGDSLDIEIRVKEPGATRPRESRSMMALPKARSPKPTPRRNLMNNQISESLMVVHQGTVKRTQFTQSAKKSKKNWTDCYMVLTTTAIYFFKDQKTFYNSLQRATAPSSPACARAELVLPLRNAHVIACIQTHTRRYTRSIKLSVNYDSYLIQDETEDGAKRWLRAIHNIIFQLGPLQLDDVPPQSSSSTDLDSLGRTPPTSRHNNKNKQKAGGSSNEDLSDTTEVSIQKSHVRSRLRKFFAKRPAMDVLIKKGIYKDEPVFGRDLEVVCPSTSPRVPEFVVECIRVIESSEENMKTDGLYRASGNLSQVQKIRLEVDQNNFSVLESCNDIHVLTGSLKLFFRELKEPVIPTSLFDRVLAACSLKPRDARIKEFRDVINILPQCNKETLKFLLEHLLRVTKYSEHNRMHTANLAIVFGPTLLLAPAHRIAIDCIQQNNVVDVLLNDYKEIFEEDNVKGKKKA